MRAGPRRGPRRSSPLLAAAAVGLALALLAWLADDARAAGSVLLGAALVVGFFAAGLLPLLVVGGQQLSAALGAGVLLLNYTLRLAVAIAVLQVASRSDAVDREWTVAAVIATALAWAAAQAVVVLRTPSPELGDQPGGGVPERPR